MKQLIGITSAIMFMLCCLTGGHAVAQEQSFDVEAYQQFLATHQDMQGSEILSDYPASLFRAATSSPAMQAQYLDSIAIKYELTPDELDLISENGFMVTERLTEKTFEKAYASIWEKDLPVFISTDAILHAVHMSYDNILMMTEKYYLIPLLSDLLGDLYAETAELQRTYGTDPAMQPMLTDVDVYIAVARALLNEKVVTRYPESLPIVNELLGLIGGESPSQYKLFSSTPRAVDFSQFTVRGHYTKEEVLGRYFRSMIWLGRTELMLTKPVQHDVPEQTDEDIQRQIIDAYLLAEILTSSGAENMLAKMDELLESLVGESDNVKVSHLEALQQEIGFAAASDLLDMSVVENFQRVLKDKPFAGQRINSQILMSNPFNPEQLKPPSAFLLLGQRFIIDSYVFWNVVYDRILYGGKKIRRMLPSSMDALFALGNDAAGQFLQDDLARYPYAANLAALRYLVDSYDDEFWNASLYNTWLHSIRALNPPANIEELPDFMQTAAWWQQKMNTQLASWAQLRHDNLLYAKQSYTGGVSCSYPEGYFEPFPEFYARLGTFARKSEQTFSEIEKLRWLGMYFNSMALTMDTLETIAGKEIHRTPLTAQEQTFLKSPLYELGICGIDFSGWYIRLFFQESSDTEDYITADVHTAPTDAAGSPVGWVYHVGTGKINLGVITAPSRNGELTAYVGPMLSFYEHVTTNFTRLTDELWKETITKNPYPRPSWVNSYLADASGRRREAGPRLMTVMTGTQRPPAALPRTAALEQNYPNPFRSGAETVFRFSVDGAAAGIVTLAVFDAAGRRVRTLLQRDLPGGTYFVRWDGMDDQGAAIPAGVYLYTLLRGGERHSNRLVVIK